MGSKESGRRGKYSAEVHAEIVRNIGFGCFPKHAAEAAGISYQCFKDWLAHGTAGREPYVAFTADVERAIATDAMRNQAIITRAAQGKHDGDWKAAAWNLERKHPMLYGASAIVEKVRELQEQPAEKPHSPWKRDDNTRSRRLDA